MFILTGKRKPRQAFVLGTTPRRLRFTGRPFRSEERSPGVSTIVIFHNSPGQVPEKYPYQQDSAIGFRVRW